MKAHVIVVFDLKIIFLSCNSSCCYLELVEFSILNKNVPIAPKPKRERKRKAAKALERNIKLKVVA